MIVTCSVKKCKSQYEVNGPLSLGFKYICRNHTRAEQKKTSGFQSYQFDPELNGKKKEAEMFDEDWRLAGTPVSLSQKCPHGVYDPLEDQRYCSVCNPGPIVCVVSEVKKTKIGKIGILKNRDELIDQNISLILFYNHLPEKSQPEWFKNKELGFRARARRIIDYLMKTHNKIGGQITSVEVHE